MAAVESPHLRFHAPHAHLGSAFGPGWFGAFAEKVARFFGTPQYLISQTTIVIAWIIFNGFQLFVNFDPFPFILLNLAFSLQAAYAAPLILLAQTRQAERDKALAEADARHRETLARESLQQTSQLETLLESNTTLTEQTKRLTEHIDSLTNQIHSRVVRA